MKKTIVITAGDNITEAIVLKLIELLSTSKVDVHHASLHAGKDITPIIGTLDDAPPITSLVTMGSPNGKAMPVTLESLDLKVTAVLDEVRAFRTYEEDEDEDDPKAPKKRKKKAATKPAKTPESTAPKEPAEDKPAAEAVEETPEVEPEPRDPGDTSLDTDKQPGDAAPEGSETTTPTEA